MRMLDRLAFVRQRVKDQEAWIASHGGDLAGYIRHYGDPGIAPCDKNGNAETIACPDDLAQACGLRPVEGWPGVYYKQHFGAGGALIYASDVDCLMRYQKEWGELEARYGRTLDRAIADQKAAKEDCEQYKGPTHRLTAELLLEDIEAAMLVAIEARQGYEAMRQIQQRLRLGRRVLGLAAPLLEMDDRPWST